MNTIFKKITTGLLGVALLAAVSYAQPHHCPMDGVSGATPAGIEAPVPLHHGHLAPTEFQSVSACYVPQIGVFVAIDSIDCAVDMLARRNGEIVRVGRYVTDKLKKRHDIKNILRPISVGIVGNKIVFIATAANTADSSYIGVLAMQPDQDGNLPLIARRDYGCYNYAFSFVLQSHELIVVGKSPAGYDFNVIDLADGLESIDQAPMQTIHYRVPKQSERIQASDPVGIGLTVVAVVVVFLALLCISLILQGYGKTIMRVQSKRGLFKPTATAKGTAEDADTEAEVMVAIAAAVHLYNDELHDEEDAVITIQKVERAWTPWNAKYYNMNHYFNRR
ncbi:MAG: OadG family protein [Bacteroidales bacterium]|nr:OadG family protein [Bacteroidales bacterium]